MHMPIARPEQLTIEQAMCGGLNLHTSANRESPLHPGPDNLPGNPDKPSKGRLTSKVENGMVKGTSLQHHDDIVNLSSSKCQSDSAAQVLKLGMTVWKNIDEELHRRRLTTAWLYKKLELSRQVVSGWKTRGVPTARYEQIATLFGWTIDRLVTGEDDTPPTPLTAVKSPPTASNVAPPVTSYSPMALDLARQLDAIKDLEKKRKAYALMKQIAHLTGDVPVFEPDPTVPDPQTPEPAGQPTPMPPRGT